MKARICDKCRRELRGPYHRVITVGKGRPRSNDFCSRCLNAPPVFVPPKTDRQAPKVPHFYDIPLDPQPTPGEEASKR